MGGGSQIPGKSQLFLAVTRGHEIGFEGTPLLWIQVSIQVVLDEFVLRCREALEFSAVGQVQPLQLLAFILSRHTKEVSFNQFIGS
jgi:hypothetical protein